MSTKNLGIVKSSGHGFLFSDDETKSSSVSAVLAISFTDLLIYLIRRPFQALE